MKREFSVLYLEGQQQGFVPGDDAAHRAAAALADRADAPTIAALTDALTLLERVGGQFHLTALRLGTEEGEWETAGLGFHYETRDARVQTAQPPEQTFGVPITDSQAPPPALETQCSTCGRKTPEERPDDPPCHCQGAEALAADHPDAPEQPVAAEAAAPPE